MRLVSYLASSGPRVAAVQRGGYVDLNAADPRLPACARQLLALGEEGLQRAREAAERGAPLDPGSVRLLPPIPTPEKILCIGLNYADHAAESGQEPPSEPVVFNKLPTAVLSPGEPIVLPSASCQVDYEAELVVVIGRGGRHIPQEEALAAVAGFTCGNDVSARDWQLGKPARQWLLGKTFDTFAPFGPELVTRDELGDCGNLEIQLRLNGQRMQHSNTRQLIFAVEHLIAYISGVCTLKPGDILFTGTPPGVGVARKPPVFLQPGDVVEVEIAGIGVLRNPVIAGR